MKYRKRRSVKSKIKNQKSKIKNQKSKTKKNYKLKHGGVPTIEELKKMREEAGIKRDFYGIVAKVNKKIFDSKKAGTIYGFDDIVDDLIPLANELCETNEFIQQMSLEEIIKLTGTENKFNNKNVDKILEKFKEKFKEKYPDENSIDNAFKTIEKYISDTKSSISKSSPRPRTTFGGKDPSILFACIVLGVLLALICTM